MAIYKRGYQAYAGPLTPAWSRFLVISRYAWRGLFRSRLLTAFFVICFFYPLGAITALYVNHSPSVLSTFHVQGSLFEVTSKFFFIFLCVQGGLAFFLATFVGPGLVSPDLANRALPLYFCRPFSRAEYVLGKMVTQFVLLSLVTWVPGILLFLVQSTLQGGGWMWSNLWIARSLVLGSVIWILLLSLLTLALSAWVKWKIAAAALMLAIVFIGAGFGKAIDTIMRTTWGAMVDIGSLITVVWCDLFKVESDVPLSPARAWIGLLVICAVCLLLLSKKLRAYEVVK
jgi:ABC-2 type transport system permease protein